MNKYEKAHERNLINTMERWWVESDKKLDALNYWYHRYFTNEFELFCLRCDYRLDDKK